jgi:hypothetical protein
MKSELQLADSIAQISCAKKIEITKSRCLCDHWEVQPGGCYYASKTTHGCFKANFLSSALIPRSTKEIKK